MVGRREGGVRHRLVHLAGVESFHLRTNHLLVGHVCLELDRVGAGLGSRVDERLRQFDVGPGIDSDLSDDVRTLLEADRSTVYLDGHRSVTSSRHAATRRSASVSTSIDAASSISYNTVCPSERRESSRKRAAGTT